MNFVCPSCRVDLPQPASSGLVSCPGCRLDVDLARIDTRSGRVGATPEFNLVGEVLGAFQLKALLGSGGMGTVYDAVWEDRPCAVKVLSPLLAADVQLRERFVREAKALRDIQHPSLVKVWALGEERGFYFYAMERIDGEDLKARLQAQGPLSVEEARRLAEELLLGLEAVHARGLIHRDIKPSNILCSQKGSFHLCDFGIAFHPGAQTLTASAAILGSLRYMSPEQLRGLRCDEASDLYSLGLVLHESLSGGLPGEKMLPRKLPKLLRHLIEQLIQSDPTKRPKTARAARHLLQPRSQWVRRGAAALAVVITAAGIVVARQQVSPAPTVPVPIPTSAPKSDTSRTTVELKEVIAPNSPVAPVVPVEKTEPEMPQKVKNKAPKSKFRRMNKKANGFAE